MKELVTKEFERLLGGQLEITPCVKTQGLSFMLLGLYNLYESDFNGHRFILMCHKKKVVYTPELLQFLRKDLGAAKVWVSNRAKR